MARKRMFDGEIINQDNFLDLSMESKALYFLLGMEADDEGFVSPKKVMRLHGGTVDSLKNLAERQLIIPFKTGVVVITDWKRNNYLDKNRIKETIYQEEKKQLNFNQNSEKYELLINPYNSSVKPMFNECLTRIEEKRVEENRREEISVVAEDNRNDELERPEYQTPNSSTTEIDIELFNYLETNFGRSISPSEILNLQSYREYFKLDILKAAIDKACINNAKNIGYVLGILRDWKSKGFKTLEECKNEFNEYKRISKPKSGMEKFNATLDEWERKMEEQERNDNQRHP